MRLQAVLCPSAHGVRLAGACVSVAHHTPAQPAAAEHHCSHTALPLHYHCTATAATQHPLSSLPLHYHCSHNRLRVITQQTTTALPLQPQQTACHYTAAYASLCCWGAQTAGRSPVVSAQHRVDNIERCRLVDFLLSQPVPLSGSPHHVVATQPSGAAAAAVA